MAETRRTAWVRVYYGVPRREAWVNAERLIKGNLVDVTLPSGNTARVNPRDIHTKPLK